MPVDLSRLYSSETNVADPDGAGADGRTLHGQQSTVDLTNAAIGKVELIYISRDNSREVLIQADVFADHIHLHCPVCRLRGHEHGLMIRESVKQWGFDPLRQVKKFPGWTEAQMMGMFPRGSGGTLSIDKFDCPWCKTKLAVDNNVVVRA